MVGFSLFGILLQDDRTLWMTLTEHCSQLSGVPAGICVVSVLGIIVLVLVVFIALVSLTTWLLLKIDESRNRGVSRTGRRNNSEGFIRRRRCVSQVNDGILPQPVTPLPGQKRSPPKDRPSASHGRNGDARSIDATHDKDVLDKRRRLKERKVNSADIIDPTALPGYFGDTNDLAQLLEHVEGQPMRQTQRAKPKKSTKKKGFRRHVENLRSEAMANDVRSDSGVALDDEVTVDEASLKDTKYDHSEEGSPAFTVQNTGICGRKKLEANDTSDTMYNLSDEISTNESGVSSSRTHLSESDGAANDDYILRPQRETATHGQGDSVSPTAPRILESVTNNQPTQHDPRPSLKRPRPRDPNAHRPDRSSQQFHFMSQIWNRFNDECDDYTTYIAASSSQ